jgi:type VI secretion system protein ImpF
LNPQRPGTNVTREKSPRAQMPLLDRLLGANLRDRDAAPLSATDSLEQLRAAVLRDLEALLNARRRRRPLPDGLPELATSIASYGIPDPAAGAYLVPEIRAALATEIETTIRRFEPRLTRVAVALVSDENALGGTLRLKVEAVLRAEPVHEAVSFETLLEPISRDVSVREI